MHWVDTHCHLDASEFDTCRALVRETAKVAGVMQCVFPAVSAGNFEAVRLLAHTSGHADGYCLGIHPLYVPQATLQDLALLDQTLEKQILDSRLLAVGEIGLDFFVPALCTAAMREKQEFFYQQQLQLARKYQLPVVLHVRKSADRLLKYLRGLCKDGKGWLGIAHAFNGSDVQAQAFVHLGFKLGFGGALTFERSKQLRHLATVLPLDALVMETDSPDMPPHWLYTTADNRDAGQPQGLNTPAELPRIAAELAALRNMPIEALARATHRNASAALPKLAGLLV
jgi:TatD DNase family protein